jgi:hypothetical protein
MEKDFYLENCPRAETCTAGPHAQCVRWGATWLGAARSAAHGWPTSPPTWSEGARDARSSTAMAHRVCGAAQAEATAR